MKGEEERKGKKHKEKESDEEFLNYGRLVSSYTKAYCSAGFATFFNPLMKEFPGISYLNKICQ